MNTRPILVVEDSDVDFSMLAFGFKRAGVSNTLIRACTSAETLKYLLGPDSTAHMAIVDLHLPDARGAEIVHAIRRVRIADLFPVIVYSSSDAASCVRDCYEAGAQGYVVKPWALTEIDAFANAVRRGWVEKTEPFKCGIPAPQFT